MVLWNTRKYGQVHVIWTFGLIDVNHGTVKLYFISVVGMYNYDSMPKAKSEKDRDKKKVSMSDVTLMYKNPTKS